MKSKTETFTLINKNLNDIEDIFFEKSISILNLSGNSFIDFIMFDETFLSNIKKLILDNNTILSFKGFPIKNQIEEISLENTPISNLNNFRILTLIAIGNHLKKINQVDITTIERSTALSYGSLQETQKILHFGWLPKKSLYQNDIISQKTINLQNKTNYNNKKSLYNLKDYKKTFKKNINNNKEIIKIEENKIEENNDPISVQIVRLLKIGGYSKENIISYLNNYFLKKNEIKKEIKKDKKKDKFEEIILENEKKIYELFETIRSIKNESNQKDEYEKIVQEFGQNLIINNKIVNNEEINFDDFNKKEIIIENEEEILRNELIKYFNLNENISNSEIIKILLNNKIFIKNNFEEEENKFDNNFEFEEDNNDLFIEEEELVSDNQFIFKLEEEEEEEFDLGISLKKKN